MLLFPALLFGTIVRTPLVAGEATRLALVGVGLVVVGAALAAAVGRWPGVDRRRHASGAQVAFRFNSYIALALAERLGGAAGLAAMAVLMAVAVPVCNVAAVWPLAKSGGHAYGRELLRNPLILATVAGLACNLAGVALPGPVATTLQRIGVAALPLGLMAVGAGLAFGAVRAAPGHALALLGIRHLALPAVAILAVPWFGLPPVQATMVVLFAALPTAASSYVLAVRMGGDGPFVAGLVTLSTLLSMASVPLALAAFERLR